MTQKSFDVAELVAKHVTVYADRAEVTRFVKTKLSHGINEVIVKKLSRSIDQDSIRVDGRGKAVISEVKYQEKHVKKEEEIRNDEKELNDKLTKLRDERTKVEQENQRWKKQRDVLEGVATQIGSSPGGGDDKKFRSGLALVSDTNFENLDKFLSYYAKRTDDIDKELNAVQKRLEKLNEEISVLERNLNTIRYDDNYMSREVSIMLDVQEDGEVELDLSYQVWNASWTPSYDIRVSTGAKNMKISYYGMIQQSTNENWNDTKLSLSTAVPRVGGEIPELHTLKVGFKPPPPPPPPVHYRPMPKMMARSAVVRHEVEACTFMAMEDAPVAMAPMGQAVASVKDSVVSTSFEIVNPTTIPSDNTLHKVTIAIVDLKPMFEYETVPSKSQFAYLKAKVINSSSYPFLPGPISVFLDSNFVAKSCIKAVSPSEEFNCSLGVDPAVRVDYKTSRKFHEETGLITKSSVLTHEQKIEIKNTKAEPIKIIVQDHLPLSSEEKLKVNLVEPSANKTEKGVSFKVNKNNNVEWEIFIPKNESREIVLKYNIEHPRGEQIEYTEE